MVLRYYKSFLKCLKIFLTLSQQTSRRPKSLFYLPTFVSFPKTLELITVKKIRPLVAFSYYDMIRVQFHSTYKFMIRRLPSRFLKR